jgi:hypothetical protein
MLVVTDASLFTRKAQLLPDSTFVVGVDTAKRLFMVGDRPLRRLI